MLLNLESRRSRQRVELVFEKLFLLQRLAAGLSESQAADALELECDERKHDNCENIDSVQRKRDLGAGMDQRTNGRVYE